jgi:hypothetical protein
MHWGHGGGVTAMPCTTSRTLACDTKRSWHALCWARTPSCCAVHVARAAHAYRTAEQLQNIMTWLHTPGSLHVCCRHMLTVSIEQCARVSCTLTVALTCLSCLSRKGSSTSTVDAGSTRQPTGVDSGVPPRAAA